MLFIHDAYAGVLSEALPISSLLSNALTILLSIVGALALLGCVIAGVIYITAGGEPERVTRAKKALTESIIGLVVALLSLVIVKTIVNLV